MKQSSFYRAITLSTLISIASLANAYNDITLINAVTNEPIGTPIVYVGDYDLTLVGDQINFRYNHETPDGSPTAQSVRFIVTDPNGVVVSDRVENQAPFSAFGDNNGDYNRFTAYGTGLIVDVKAYSEKFAQGDIVGGSVYLATFSRSSSSTAGLQLINADSNSTVASISNGQTFSIADIGSNLNLNAVFGELEPEVSSVVFDQFNGDANQRTVENVAPYALFGDIAGNFKGEVLAPGTISIRIRAYSGSNGTGTELSNMTYVFTLME